MRKTLKKISWMKLIWQNSSLRRNIEIRSRYWHSMKIWHRHNLIFFQMMIPLLAYVATFSEQLHFGRICFFTVSTSSEQLDLRVIISIQQLPFSNSCVFRAATFLEQQLFHIFHFFSAVNFFFQNRYAFRAKLLLSI